ncbi:MAG TPA: peptidase M64 [Bacteroidales bacterium]|nr:peptidase M64 [Bacteroidales bacterium]
MNTRIRYLLKISLAIFFLLFASLFTAAQIQFEDWFENKTLRIDYFLSGNEANQHIFLDELKAEPYWSGPLNKTIDTLNLGSYKVDVWDIETKKLLYSKGFCTLFQEWQTVHEASYLDKSFEQVTRIPFPKHKVLVRFSYRDKSGKFEKLFEFDVDPSDMNIHKHDVEKYKTTQIVNNGNYSNKLDIAFIAEGYLPEQMDKFIGDVKRFTGYLFSQEPFSGLKTNINIWAIESPSKHTGPTNPGKQIWNTTAVQSSFYTFGIDRYLTTTKFKRVMDIAANAPADIIYVIVNTKEYGGGGIYNHYNVCTSNHAFSNEVFIHELGHGLAGLGDEYYDSDVAYQDFYPFDVEPWEPNITSLVNFSMKWQDMVLPKTLIPTPVTAENSTTIGVYEGAGYTSKRVYRPYIDCRMKSNSAPSFCPVCKRSIERVVYSFTD